MATGADTQEPISISTQKMQAEVIDEVETMKTFVKSNVATSEDESFLKSPEVAKVASAETCGISERCQAEEIPCQAVNTTPEDEENMQKEVKLQHVEETGKKENKLMEETKEEAEKGIVDNVTVNVTGSSTQATNNEKPENIEDENSLNVKGINFQQLEIVEKHASVEEKLETRDKEARDLETITDALNEKESITNVKPIEDEIRKTGSKEENKESDQVSNSASQEKSHDTDQSSAAGVTDSTEDGFTLPQSESPQTQNDEKVKLEIGESAQFELKEISEISASDMSSTAPGKEEKLKEDSSTAVDEKNKGTEESTLVTRSLSQVENDIKDKNLEIERIPDQQVEATIEEKGSVEKSSESTCQEASNLQKNEKAKVIHENTDILSNKEDPSNIEAASGKKEMTLIHMLDPAVERLKEDEILPGEEKCPEAIKPSETVRDEEYNKEKAVHGSIRDGLTLTVSENPYTQNDEEAKVEISANEKVEVDELLVKQAEVVLSTHETGTEESEKLKEVTCPTTDENEQCEVAMRSTLQVEDKEQDIKDLDVSVVKKTEEICLRGEKGLDLVHSIPEMSTIYMETKEELEDEREILKEIDQANFTSSEKDRKNEDTEQKIKSSSEKQDSVQTAGNKLPTTEPSQEKKDDERSSIAMAGENIHSTQSVDDVDHSRMHTENKNILENEKLSGMVSDETADAALSRGSEACHRTISRISEQTSTESEVAKEVDFDIIAMEMKKPQETNRWNLEEKSGSKEAEERIEVIQKEEAGDTETRSITKEKNTERCEQNFQINSHLEEMPEASNEEKDYKVDDIDETYNAQKEGQEGNQSADNLNITMEPSHELIQKKIDEIPENNAETAEALVKENEENEKEINSKIEKIETVETRESIAHETNEAVESSKSIEQETSDLQKNEKEEEVIKQYKDIALNKQDPRLPEATSCNTEMASIHMLDPAVDGLKDDEILAGEEKCSDANKQIERVGDEEDNKDKADHDSIRDGLTLTASENPYTQNDEDAKLEISENEKADVDELFVKQAADVPSTHENGTEESEKLKEVFSATTDEKEQYEVESKVAKRSIPHDEHEKQDVKDLDASVVKETEEICLQGEKSLDIIHFLSEISTSYQETKEEPEDQSANSKETDRDNSTSSEKDRENEDIEEKIKGPLEKQDNVQTAGNKLPTTEPSQEKKDNERSSVVMDEENINSSQSVDDVEHSRINTEHQNIPENEKLENSSMISDETADAAASGISEACHITISRISEQTITESEVAKELDLETTAMETEKAQEAYRWNLEEESAGKEAEKSIEVIKKEEACDKETHSITKEENIERCEQNFQVNSHLEEMPVASSKDKDCKADDIDETNSAQKEGEDGKKSTDNLEITTEPSNETIQKQFDEVPENNAETAEALVKENEDEKEIENSKIEIETVETSESLAPETNETVENSKSTEQETIDLQKNEKEEEDTDIAFNKHVLSTSEATSGKTEKPSGHTHDLDEDSLNEDDKAVTEDFDINENIVNSKSAGDEEKKSDSSILAGKESGPEANTEIERMEGEEDNKEKAINDSIGDGLTLTSSESPTTYNGEKAKIKITEKVEQDEDLSVKQAAVVSSTHKTGPEEGENFKEVSSTASGEKEQYEVVSSVATRSMSKVEDKKQDMNNLDASVVKETEEICLQEEKSVDIVHSVPEISVVDRDSEEVELILKEIDQPNSTASGKDINNEGTEQKIKGSFEKQVSRQTVGNELPIREPSEEKKDGGGSTVVMIEDNIYNKQITDDVESREIDAESYNKFPENEKTEISSSMVSEETADVAVSNEHIKEVIYNIEETAIKIHVESIEGKGKEDISAFTNTVDEDKLLDEKVLTLKKSPLTEKNETVEVLTKREKPDEVTYSEPEVQEANGASQEVGKHIDDASDEFQVMNSLMSEQILTEREVAKELDSETTAMEMENPQEACRLNSEEKSESIEAQASIEGTQKKEEGSNTETHTITTETMQVQHENKTGNLKIKMETSQESIQVETENIFEKNENNEETQQDIIKENREAEKEIQKLKSKTEAVEIKETSKIMAREINQTIESLEETLCTPVNKEEESLQKECENQKEGSQMEKSKSSTITLAEENSTQIGLVEAERDKEIKTSKQEDSNQILFGSEAGEQPPDVMVVAIQTNVEEVSSLEAHGNTEDNAEKEEPEEVYKGCKLVGKGEEMSGKEPYEEPEETGTDKDAEEQISRESITKDQGMVFNEVEKVEHSAKDETTAMEPPKQEAFETVGSSMSTKSHNTEERTLSGLSSSADGGGKTVTEGLTKGESCIKLDEEVNSSNLALLDKTEETGLVENSKDRPQPNDNLYPPEIANAPEETSEDKLNGDIIKNNFLVSELPQRDTKAETSVEEDTATTYFESAVATVITEEKVPKDTETKCKKQVESCGQPVEEKGQAIVGTESTILDSENVNSRDDTANLAEKQKKETTPIVDDTDKKVAREAQLETPNSGTEGQQEEITSESPLQECSTIQSEEKELLNSESNIGEIEETGSSVQDKEGKKESKEATDLKLEVEKQINQKHNANEMIKGVILSEEVHKGVPTADYDGNIKEQVVENKSGMDELHTASTTDEKNDEVKEHSPVCSVQAAESNEQEETKVSDVEEGTTKDRETSITKESENEAQDKGPESKLEKKSEEKIENKQETQNFYNKSDAANVEAATPDTSPEEAQIDVKILDGLNTCSDETNPETTNNVTGQLTELSKEVEIEKPLHNLASESPTDDPEPVETEVVTIYNQNDHDAEETKIAAKVVYPSKELNAEEIDETGKSPTVIRSDQLPASDDEYAKEATTSLENPDADEHMRTKLVADTVNDFNDQGTGESSTVEKLDVYDGIEVEASKIVFDYEHEDVETDAQALPTEKSADSTENPSSKLPFKDEEWERTITIVSKKEEETMEAEILENVGQPTPSNEKTGEEICLQKEQTRELGTVDEEKSAADQTLATETLEEIYSQEKQTEEVCLPKKQAKKLTANNEESPPSQTLSKEVSDKQVESPYSALPSEKQKQITATEVNKIEDIKAKEEEMADDESAEGSDTSKTIPDIHLQVGEQKEIEVSKKGVYTADQTLLAGTLEYQLQTPSASPSDEQQLKTKTIVDELEKVNLPENETQDNSYTEEATEETFWQKDTVKVLAADQEDESTDEKAPPEEKSEVQLQTPSSTLPPEEQGHKPTTKSEKIEEKKHESNESHHVIVSMKTTEEFSPQEATRDIEGANKNEIAADKHLQVEKLEELNMSENVCQNDSSVAKVTAEILLQKEDLEDLQTVKQDGSIAKQALPEETSDIKLPNPPSTSPSKEGETESERIESGEIKEEGMLENESHQVLEFFVQKEEVADLGAANNNECAAENTLQKETSEEATMPMNEGLIDSFSPETTNPILLQKRELKVIEAVKENESADEPEQALPEGASDLQLQTPSSTLPEKEQKQETTKTKKIEEEILENESQQVPVTHKTEEFSLQKKEVEDLRDADETLQLERSEEVNRPEKEALVDSSIAKATEEAFLQKEELKELEVHKEDENLAKQTLSEETLKVQPQIPSSTSAEKEEETQDLGAANENEIAADKALQTEKSDEQIMTANESQVDSSITRTTEEIFQQKEEFEDLEAVKEDESTEQDLPEETSDLLLQTPSSTSPQKEKEEENIKFEKIVEEEKKDEERLENESHQVPVTVETREEFSQKKQETTDLEATEDALQAETDGANTPENEELLDSFVTKKTERKLLEQEALTHLQPVKEDESTAKKVILEETSELQLQTPSSLSPSEEQEQKTTTEVEKREEEGKKSEDMLENDNDQVPDNAKTNKEFSTQKKEATDLGAAGETESAADDASQTEKSDIANKIKKEALLDSFITEETEEIFFQKEDPKDFESAKEYESKVHTLPDKTLARKCAAEQTLSEETSEMQLQTPPSTSTPKEQEQKTETEIEKIEEEGKEEERTLENERNQAAAKTTEDTSLPKAEATDLGAADKVLKEEKSKEENKLKNESLEDSFITNATKKILLQKEEPMDHGTTKIEENTINQSLPEEILDMQHEILASTLPPKDQEEKTITEVGKIEKDKGKEEEILGSESRELSIAIETREELCLQKEQASYPGAFEEIKSYANQAVIAVQSEKEGQTPSSALPSGEQQQGLLSTSKNIEEEIPRKEEMVKHEPQEESFTSSTTEKIHVHKEESRELEVVTEESRKLKISISGTEVSKDAQESPSELHQEKEIKDGDSRLQVEESEKESNHVAPSLESEKTSELPKQPEEPSCLEVEPSEKVLEFESQIQSHELLIKSDDVDIKEKQHGAAITDLKPKGKTSEMTIEANEPMQNEVSSEKIMEKLEVAESSKGSCQEEELRTEEYLREKKLPVETEEIHATKELEELILPRYMVLENVEKVSTEEKVSDVTKDAANRTDSDHKDEINFEKAKTKDITAGQKVEMELKEAESEMERLEETETMTSVSDLLQKSIKETSEEAKHETEQREPISREEGTQIKESDTTKVKEAKTDEEEGDESKKADSGSDGPVIVEVSRDMENKIMHKKSHGILSGVGSKVKHSISKVKKAITGKSSHPKHHRNEAKEEVSPSS